MNLLIRDHCQPILDAVGLSECYVTMYGNYQRYIQIVNPCGKPLFDITSISFSKVNPTITEIKVCAKLLGEFFETHYAKLQAYFKARAKLASTENAHIKNTDFSINSSTINKKLQAGITVVRNGETLTYWLPAKQFSYVADNAKLSKLGTLLRDTDLHAEMHTLAVQSQKYKQATCAVEEALAELAKCNI